MTGPEHYKEAEDLIQAAESEIRRPPDESSEDATRMFSLHKELERVRAEHQRRFPESMKPDEMIAAAHVHAILALAAATALGSSGQERANDPGGMADRIRQAWESSAGEPSPRLARTVTLS